MSTKPNLSVVATSRNDDHGGNLGYRMQLFVSGFIAQCKRHDFNAELVLVEWNPPADRPKLTQALQWPEDASPCTVRIIEVPVEIHQRFRYWDGLPLFQMIGKNVGIRLAAADFVLATNIDILFSDELIDFLQSGKLKKDRMYRIDRHDVIPQIPLDAPFEQQLAFCRENVMRIQNRRGILDPNTGTYTTDYGTPKRRDLLIQWLIESGLLQPTRRSQVNTMASGDFTLLAKDQWFALRGYAEFEIYSMHLDSLLCHAAIHNGVREEMLIDPMRIYHVEHGAGSGWTPEGKDQLNLRLDALGVPQLPHHYFDLWAIQMRRMKQPYMFNDENWGLANETLPETGI